MVPQINYKKLQVNSFFWKAWSHGWLSLPCTERKAHLFLLKPLWSLSCTESSGTFWKILERVKMNYGVTSINPEAKEVTRGFWPGTSLLWLLAWGVSLRGPHFLRPSLSSVDLAVMQADGRLAWLGGPGLWGSKTNNPLCSKAIYGYSLIQSTAPGQCGYTGIGQWSRTGLSKYCLDYNSGR